MTQLTASVEEYRIAQQERYARQSDFYRAQSKLNRPFSLTIRQTQTLMNKYSVEKAMIIASRFNSIMEANR